MNDKKQLDVALLLADVAEGCFTMIESLKLIADSLDSTANLLREGTPLEEDDNK